MSEIGLGDGVEIEVPSKLQRRVKNIQRHIQYPTDDFIENVPRDTHPLIPIPRKHIFGRQRMGEYEEYKRDLAIKAFEEDPRGFLENKPVSLCMVPDVDGGSRLVIIDGHHRFRESGRLKEHDADSGTTRMLYSKVPSQVFTPEETADLLNNSGKRMGDGSLYTAAKVVEEFSIDSAAAEQDFDGMPAYKRPVLIGGVTTVKQLQEKLAA